MGQQAYRLPRLMKRLKTIFLKAIKMCVFPDALDKGANLDIGYMPGEFTVVVGKSLKKLGVEVVK